MTDPCLRHHHHRHHHHTQYLLFIAVFTCNSITVPYNISGLCNPGPVTLRKPWDKIEWVSAALNG